MGVPEEMENVPKTMQYDSELNGGAIRTIEIAVQFRNVLNGVPSNLEKKIEVGQTKLHSLRWCTARAICLQSFNSFLNCSSNHLICCKRFLKSKTEKLKSFRLKSSFLGNRFSELKRLCVGVIPD